MEYLNYILKKLNLTNSTTGFSYINPTSDKQSIGKTKITTSISNKSLKLDFIIYFIMILFFCFPICLWYLFFPKTINDLLDINIINVNKPGILSTLILFISIIVLNILYIIIKRHILFKNHESKPKNINIYNRELPENLTPAHVRLLVLDGKIDAKTLASTILDLIDKGYLTLEENNTKELFTKDLLISKTNKSQEDLFGYEKYLINWFFEEDKISSFKLRQKLNDTTTNPNEKFAIFQGLVFISFPLNRYYKTNYTKKTNNGIKALLFAITLQIFVINIVIKNPFLFGISELFAVFALSNIIFHPPTYLLNEVGAEIKDSYLDLKKYLDEFSLIKEKNSQMIILWNYYLSYSIALDINGIANDEINNFFGYDIYNLNNQTLSNQDLIKTLIDNIPNEENISKELYKKRNINY